MPKKSARRSVAKQSNVRALHAYVRPWEMCPGSEPREHRDQRYVRKVRPKTDTQRALIEALDSYHMVLALGPAGTGKTYLSIAKAVEALEAGDVQRIVLTRPAMEAGESIGYLPGSLHEKMAPYLRPLFDALSDQLGSKQLGKLLAEGTIEIAPVGNMRGRILNRSYVVIDEAQNCTYGQIKMLLTRLGWNSTMVVTGDPDQSDLLPGISGLEAIGERLEALEDVTVLLFSKQDVVRHPLVSSILEVV